jgi:hypothetical protein
VGADEDDVLEGHLLHIKSAAGAREPDMVHKSTRANNAFCRNRVRFVL